MMQTFADAYNHFSKLKSNDPDWLQSWRSQSWANFLKAGLPTREWEDWRYLNLRKIYNTQFDIYQDKVDQTKQVRDQLGKFIEKLGLEQALNFVVFNGQCIASPTELPPGLEVTNLAENLIKTEGHSLYNRNLSGSTANPFALLNEAFLDRGFVIRISEDTSIVPVVHLLHVISTEQGTNDKAFFPRHMIKVEKNAKICLIETFASFDATSESVAETSSKKIMLCCPSTVMHLDEGAELRHLRIQQENQSTQHIGYASASLAKGSQLFTFSLANSFFGGALVGRIDIEVSLTDVDARVSLDGLYLCKDDQVIDHHTVVDHLVPKTHSTQLYKGIADDKSRAIFNGKIIVRDGAHGTVAQQTNRNLLLSSDAEIDTKPELQIDADDVKCSHGAAIGQLDPDQLFYLETRGISPVEAHRILLQGFADEVLQRLPVSNPKLKSWCASLTQFKSVKGRDPL